MPKRRALIALLVVITAAALVAAPLMAQTDSEGVPDDPAATAEEMAADAAELLAQELGLFAEVETVALNVGDHLKTPEWDLEVQNVFIAPSPSRDGYSEVKVAIAIRNNLEVPFPYRVDGFRSTLGYPRLTLFDSADNVYAYSLNRLADDALPGSNLIEILPGLSGRWTVGFQVRTPFIDEMILETSGSTAIGQWSLTPGGSFTGFALPDFDLAGAEITWSEDLTVMPQDHGSFVCGDPDRQMITQIFAVSMDVMNSGVVERMFPGTRFPDHVAIAQWSNGAASRMMTETHNGDNDSFQWAGDATVISPGDSAQGRSMVFTVPRDGRVGLVDDAPQGILFVLPDGRQTWLEISGQGNLEIDPAFCDLGGLAGTVPFSFSPGSGFDVAPADLGVDNTAADQAANVLLNEAAVAAAALIGPSGDFADITAGALGTTGSPLTFAASLAAGGRDVVGVEAFPDDDVVSFSTQSASGNWYCLSIDETRSLTTYSAQSFGAVATFCTPTEETQTEAETPTTTVP